jgi:hypothetical protein
MDGALAGIPGTRPNHWSASSLTGLTFNFVDTGVEDGINYVSIQAIGTAGATAGSMALFEGTQQIAAVSGQVRAGSFFCALEAGSTSGVTSLQCVVTERSAAGSTLVQSASTVTPTPGSLRTKRFSTTRTLNNASTAYVTNALILNVTNGAAIDITLRIGMPQLERDVVTNVIPTSGAAATRSADVADITGTDFSDAYAQAGSSLVTTFYGRAAGTSVIWSIDDGTSDERIVLYSVAGALKLDVTGGGVLQASLALGTISTGVLYKVAARLALNDIAASINGAEVVTDALATLPTPTQLRIGSNGTNWANTVLDRLSLYPTPLSDSILRGLSA